MRSVASVCVSICVCVSILLYAVTYESLGLETSFLVRRYVFRISRSSSYIKVNGSRSRSQQVKKSYEQNQIHVHTFATDPSSIGRQAKYKASHYRLEVLYNANPSDCFGHQPIYM